MVSFDSTTMNKTVRTLLYVAAALVLAYVAYKLYLYVFPAGIPNPFARGMSLDSYNIPAVTGQGNYLDQVNDSDFDYIHGQTYVIDGLAGDPSNDVQKYKKVQDATGRSFWEPIPMLKTTDYLTNTEYDSIVDRHINRNMVGNLHYLTQPKYIRNADNFWGTYKPTENTLDKCLDERDVPHEGGLLADVKWGQ